VSERKRSTLAWAIASVVVGIGAVMLIIGLLTPVTFGWFAYQPLADTTFVPGGGGVFLSRTTIVGTVVLTIGLLAVAFLAGWRAARARPNRLEPDSAN
jgi:heme/copper-type cytochrome/quinol oxidase subunit 1